MARTMSKKDNETLKNFISNKSRELTDRQDIINYFVKVGFCDKNCVVIYPYTDINREK